MRRRVQTVNIVGVKGNALALIEYGKSLPGHDEGKVFVPKPRKTRLLFPQITISISSIKSRKVNISGATLPSSCQYLMLLRQRDTVSYRSAGRLLLAQATSSRQRIPVTMRLLRCPMCPRHTHMCTALGSSIPLAE